MWLLRKESLSLWSARFQATPPQLLCGSEKITELSTPLTSEDYRIEHSIDFQITYESSYARLVIREAFAEDSGRFTCTATSEAGTISTSCYLLVKGTFYLQYCNKISV